MEKVICLLKVQTRKNTGIVFFNRNRKWIQNLYSISKFWNNFNKSFFQQIKFMELHFDQAQLTKWNTRSGQRYRNSIIMNAILLNVQYITTKQRISKNYSRENEFENENERFWIHLIHLVAWIISSISNRLLFIVNLKIVFNLVCLNIVKLVTCRHYYPESRT